MRNGISIWVRLVSNPVFQGTNGFILADLTLIGANSHLMGTTSMMPRDMGGVVDSELRLYGTANVWVVDASVLPTQISGHLTAALYAVAERASDIIKRTSRHI